MDAQHLGRRRALTALFGLVAMSGGPRAAAPTPSAPVSAPAGARRVARPAAAMFAAIDRAGARLVAVGEHGLVTLSDDHGVSWRQAAAVPTDASLTAVRFADERTGWAAGHQGVLLATEDGGEHWQRQLDAAALAALPGGAPAGAEQTLLDLVVLDAGRLLAVGAYGLALASEDGGRQWRSVSQRFDNPGRLHVYGIVETAHGLVAVGEQGLLLREEAGGTLRPSRSPYEGSLFGLLRTRDGLLAYGLRGNAYTSRDGGANWTAARLPADGSSLNTALALAGGRLLLGTQGGRVLASDDGGASFTATPAPPGAPVTGLVEAADGAVVVASLGGLVRLGDIAHGASR